ncbi:tRNA uracil 4-sulfurtransferase ThiI [Clostridiisalibacter paucivorans]|uniref:tRNA uracil 4-sulfurtransferase ThiI n=1 Tax=Clostridiisalibacter paucivorans TaxID=408753 RepID=UPI00047B3899|nr:tRNA uracil 4-sulfurtransferase ThiI [Clostridiisalibacter paucivorans]
MDRVISISFGEIVLKGGNRGYFEKELIKHIKNSIKDLGKARVYRELGKAYVEVDEINMDNVIKRLVKVFGIVHINPAYRVDKDIDIIKNASVKVVKDIIKEKGFKTFKVKVKRADKKFPIKSMDVAKLLGGEILKNVDDLKVDVHNPDMYLYIDIRDKVYLYTEKIKAYGGLPIGTNGRGLLLLSGGIDSPVAGFMIAKRGVKIDAIHYHSYPFTSERAEEKVKALGSIIARYCGEFNLYSINLLNIQKEINKNCPEDEMTLISRRFMMRIAERVAEREGIDALVTGESLGQVASQTIKSLNVTNSIVHMPIFRPLIGMDKTQIMDISHDIETYETSILPYEDCCTVFLPKHPVTRPKLEDIEDSEKSLDIESLVDDALNNMKIMKIKP